MWKSLLQNIIHFNPFEVVLPRYCQMNRTLINILTVTIIAVLAFSVLSPISDFISGFSDSMATQNSVARSESVNTFNNPVVIGLNPETNTLINPIDTITFKDGQSYPIIYKEAIMMIPEKNAPGWTDVVVMVSYVIDLIAFIILVVDFIKFVFNINKGKIFVRINSRLLRRISLWLFIMTACSLTTMVSDTVSVANISLPIEGYEIAALWDIPWTTLLLGILSLLMAQIWARGIALHEEQKYTI